MGGVSAAASAPVAAAFLVGMGCLGGGRESEGVVVVAAAAAACPNGRDGAGAPRPGYPDLVGSGGGETLSGVVLAEIVLACAA